jgi:hypothetical protein
MNTTRQMALAFLAALLAGGLAACGSPGSTSGTRPAASKPAASRPPADPLAKLTAPQVFDKAIAGTADAPDVHFSFSDTTSGADSAPGVQGVTAALEIARGKGCTGTVYENSLKDGPLGTLQVVALGDTIWTKPDATFWQDAAKNHPAPVATALLALTGKYVQDSASGTSDFAKLGSLCVLSGILKSPSSVGMTGKLTKDGVSQYDGQQVVTVMDASQNAYAVVTDTSAPLLVEVEPPSETGLGTLSFSDYGQPPTITAPPSSEVVDGSQYGL